ncbi:MAG TPA: GntR family transcriptional regulator [Chloroflexota bacterium]|nr:GntR family transcriptional regulator [Chloroflexota bacterium]
MYEPVNPFRPPASLVDEVVRVLTDRIVRGDLPPGTRLVEERLAREFGISRQPIRESFRILQREGLVRIVPRRGVYVKAPSPHEVLDIYDCRSVLGGLAARLATQRMTPEVLSQLEALLAEMEAAVAARDVARYFQLNVRFHEVVDQASCNQTLRDLLRTLGTQVLRLRFMSLSLPGRMERSFEIHRQVVAAFRARDAARAAWLSQTLIEEAGQALIAHLTAQPAESGATRAVSGAAADGAAS